MKKYLIVTKSGYNKIVNAKSILDAINYSQIKTNLIVIASILPDEKQENEVITPETEM